MQQNQYVVISSHNHKEKFCYALQVALLHDVLEVSPKSEFLEVYQEPADTGSANSVRLSPGTYEKARGAGPTWDIHFLEQEWRMWMSEPPRHPDGAFLGFCRKWHERKGRAP